MPAALRWLTTCAGAVALALTLPVVANGKTERWTGTLTRAYWYDEAYTPRAEEPVSFTLSADGRTVTEFRATVTEQCFSEQVNEDGVLETVMPATERIRVLTHPGPIAVEGDNRAAAFTVAVGSVRDESAGIEGQPGSWEFSAVFTVDAVGNYGRLLGGNASFEPEADGCSAALGPDDPYNVMGTRWRVRGPALARLRVGASVRDTGTGYYPTRFVVRNRHGKPIRGARVSVIEQADPNDPFTEHDWRRRRTRRNGSTTIGVSGQTRFDVVVEARGFVGRSCTLNVRSGKLRC